MNRFDLQSAALRLSAEMMQEGMPGWAGKLMEATSLGTTGAELCMTLRTTLLQFMRAGASGSPRTLRLVQELLHEIEPVLI
jgi:hypothetical protein